MTYHISIPTKKCCLFTVHSRIPEATDLSQILPTQVLEPGLFTSPIFSIPLHRIHYQTLTISWHTHCQALLQPAVLAAVAAGAVDQAVLLTGAGVGCIALLTPSEEALCRKRSRRHCMNHCGWLDIQGQPRSSQFQCWTYSCLIYSILQVLIFMSARQIR